MRPPSPLRTPDNSGPSLALLGPTISMFMPAGCEHGRGRVWAAPPGVGVRALWTGCASVGETDRLDIADIALVAIPRTPQPRPARAA